MLKLLDTRLRGFERLFLHDDRLRHIVWRTGLPADLVADEALRLRIAWRRLALDIGELLEEVADCLLIVLVHEMLLLS